MPVNVPGHWDFYISYVTENPYAQTYAVKLHDTLIEKGKTAWMYENMLHQGHDARQEGVRNSSCVIAIVTDEYQIESKAYFKCDICLNDLKWAKQYCKFIQPVYRKDDEDIKQTFRAEVRSHLKLKNIRWIHLRYHDDRSWDTDVDLILKSAPQSPSNNVLEDDETQLDEFLQKHKLCEFKSKLAKQGVNGYSQLQGVSEDTLRKCGFKAMQLKIFSMNRPNRDMPTSSDCTMSKAPAQSPPATRRTLTNANIEAMKSALDFRGLVKVLQTSDVDMECTLLATSAIKALSKNKKHKAPIVQAGAVEPLVQLLRPGNDEVRSLAAGTLKQLADTAESKAAILCAGAAQLLIKLLGSRSTQGRSNAAGAIKALSTGDVANDTAKYDVEMVGAVEPLVQLLHDGDSTGKARAAAALGAFKTNKNMIRIAAAGAVDPLVRLLRTGDADGKSQAAYALGSLAISDSIKLGLRQAVCPLVQFFKTQRSNTHAVRALSNIAFQNHPVHDDMVQSEVGTPLAEMLRIGDILGKKHAVNLVVSLACNNKNHQMVMVRADAVAPLVHLLSEEEIGIKNCAAEALSSLGFEGDTQDTMVGAGAIDPLVTLLSTGNAQGKMHAAWALRNLAYFNDNNKIRIENAGAFKHLVRLLLEGDNAVQTKAAGALSTLAFQKPTIQKDICKAGAVPALVQLLAMGDNAAKTQAADALANLACDNDNKVTIAKENALSPLIELLDTGEADGKCQAARVLKILAWNTTIKAEMVRERAVAPLVRLFSTGDDEGKLHAGKALKLIAQDNKSNQQLIQAVELLVQILKGAKPADTAVAAEILTCLARLDAECQLKVANAGAVEPLVKLLNTGEPCEKIIAMNAIDSLTINNTNNKNKFVGSGTCQLLESLLRSGDGKVRKAAERTLGNLR